MEYEIIRSDRRSISAGIKEGRLIVRAPRQMSEREIEAFLARHRRWIESHIQREEEKRRAAEKCSTLTPEALRDLVKKAMQVIPERVAYYAPKVGVTYRKITIRLQRTLWGSCSAKGDLSFNALLMLAPIGAIDSIVVHELCHRKEMNHSRRFYAEVLRVFPNYYTERRWLKENGYLLFAAAKR